MYPVVIYLKYTASHSAFFRKKWKAEREISRLLKTTWFLSKDMVTFYKKLYELKTLQEITKSI